MLPYPSAKSLHMGHVFNYTMGDVVTHYHRRNGARVLRPMGWDAFGLPAENAAIREGGHPRDITESSIVLIREQMQRLGWAIDWDREVSSHDPRFYKWTQWLFLRFFERGLAYRKEAPVNWCPNDQTVIANEYVVDGHCERCGALIELRNMTQWFFKTTAYADELRKFELPPGGEWPERTKTIQRNWIGRSEGAEIIFRIEELEIDVDEVLVDSGEFTGMPADVAKAAIVTWLHDHGRGAPAVSFRLRDWSFSRQRYWGCPIPIVYCGDCGVVPVPDQDLPVLLPD